jgi:hypothetical protein
LLGRPGQQDDGVQHEFRSSDQQGWLMPVTLWSLYSAPPPQVWRRHRDDDRRDGDALLAPVAPMAAAGRRALSALADPPRRAEYRLLLERLPTQN